MKIEKLTFDEVVTACGGKQALRREFNITSQAFCMWKKEDRFPEKHWPNLVRLGGGTVKYEHLALLREEQIARDG